MEKIKITDYIMMLVVFINLYLTDFSKLAFIDCLVLALIFMWSIIFIIRMVRKG